MESVLVSIDNKATAGIVEKKEMIKIEVRDGLRTELVTREIFDEAFRNLRNEMRERFNVVDEKFKSLNFKLTLFLAIALIALTFANPTFVELVKKVF